jgi:DNA-binding LytR/AlgR family response regulator
MGNRLRCVLVDSDIGVHETIRELCESSSLATVTHSYDSSRKFLQEQTKFEYDVCMLDIGLPDLDGILVAQLLKGKPVIFVTTGEERLKDAIDLGPIDIVFKPLKKERLHNALEKAYLFAKKNIEDLSKQLKSKHQAKEYASFNVAEESEKVRLKVTDILVATTDVNDPRNKKVVMRNGEKYTLKHCNFERLIELNPNLVQVNRSEVISIEAVQRFRHDIIYLKCLSEAGKPRYSNLNRVYRQRFMELIAE